MREGIVWWILKTSVEVEGMDSGWLIVIEMQKLLFSFRDKDQNLVAYVD